MTFDYDKYHFFRRLITASFFFVLTFVTVDAQEVNEDDNDTIAAEVDSAATDSVLNDSIAALPWPENIRYQINNYLKNKLFETSQVGMEVYDLTADSVIFAYNEKQRMRPASTMKLLTAITAINTLGGSYRFRTQVYYTGRIDSCILNGDVYCVGGFDPRFNGDDMNAFVESFRRMGVDTIRGDLYADVSMKDGSRLGLGWCWDDGEDPLSPLLISRKDNFMNRFAEELQEHGIYVTGNIKTGTLPNEAYAVNARFHSIDQILMRMMKESDNLYAEAMFYQIAASTGAKPASYRHARNVIKQLIAKFGIPASNYDIADGSGLSLYNYVTPELEVAFLKYAYANNNIYLHLYPSLPIAGIDGTLKNRMHAGNTFGNVHAKTGSVTGVSSLAGYCKASNGHNLCFSIINQGVNRTREGRRFQDKVCQALCN
jgi:D-alanyl-D-alanine carboxypeptidase/D-alanyl-D-alanine-endopeptidase (penicillin-binding protein 4)